MTNPSDYLIAFLFSIFLFGSTSPVWGQSKLQLVEVVEGLPLTQPLSILFTDSLEIVTGDIFAYRNRGSEDAWSLSPADSSGAHSLSWKKLPDGNSVYYAVGTNKGQILKFDAIDRTPQAFDSVDIPELVRPHDVIYNPEDGYFYVIDAEYISEKKNLIRFKDLAEGYETLNLDTIFKQRPHTYARALTLDRGRVYIILSSYGEVVRIDDFKQGTYRSFGYKERSPVPAGSYTTTGLVLNDVAYYNGYWYGTNYFSADHANGTDYHAFRFIRWKTWDGFENNRFEDLSDLIGKEEVPYYITLEQDRLYLVTFSDKASGNEPVAAQYGSVYIFEN